MSMTHRVKAWLVRHSSGTLAVFVSELKPFKEEAMFEMWLDGNIENGGDGYFLLPKTVDIPQVQWTDKEPKEIEITIKICE